MGGALLFSTIEVTKQVGDCYIDVIFAFWWSHSWQAFYRTPLSYAIVNLKPIVPGHVLVIPTRHVPRLADLTIPELTSLMSSVQQVGQVIEKAYSADALTIACQVIMDFHASSIRGWCLSRMVWLLDSQYHMSTFICYHVSFMETNSQTEMTQYTPPLNMQRVACRAICKLFTSRWKWMQTKIENQDLLKKWKKKPIG